MLRYAPQPQKMVLLLWTDLMAGGNHLKTLGQKPFSMKLSLKGRCGEHTHAAPVCGNFWSALDRNATLVRGSGER